MQDPYCYPNSRTLKNKLNITDQDILRDEERNLSHIREAELFHDPIRGYFDFNHLKRIHAYLFQDLYNWAGEVRTVDIAKGNMFCRFDLIDVNAKEIFNELKRENYLQALGAGQMAKRLAYYLCEINSLHPFREGNGRTQREFIRELAFQNDYLLTYSDITKDEIIAASKAGFLRDYSLMEELIGRSLRPA